MTVAPAPLRLRPAHLLAGAGAGGIAAANLSRPTGLVLSLPLALLVGAILASRPLTRLLLIAATIAALGWLWGGHRIRSLDRSPLLALIGRAGDVEAVITGPASVSRFATRVPATVRSFDGRPIGEPVELELHPGAVPQQGAVIDTLSLVKLPDGPRAGFDERGWLRLRGIHVVLRVDRWQAVGRRGGIGGVADRIRSWLGRAMAPGLGGVRRAVVEGVVLGDGAALPASTRADFRNSGLYHLMAVSGQNVVFVAAGAALLAWLVGLGRWSAECCALAAIGAYVLAVGPQPSVVRAGIAGALGSLAWLVGRLRDAWHALLVAAVVLLAWNPYLVHDPGFQLSFTAVAAIFLVVPPLAQRLEAVPFPLPRSVRLGLAVSLACGVLTAPIVWIQFGYLPLLGIVANVFAEPAMPLLLGLSFSAAALDAVWPAAAGAVAWLNGWVAAYLALCAHVFGSLPFAVVRTGRGMALLCALLLAGVYLVVRQRLAWAAVMRARAIADRSARAEAAKGGT